MPFNWFKKSGKQKKQRVSLTPIDFNALDTREKVQQAYQEGKLVRMYLMPLEYSGAEVEVNALYVPEEVRALKGRFDGMIYDLLVKGESLHYDCNADYKENSRIPSSITIKVTGDSTFSETIQIW